jgi:hypothetical protein
MSDIGPLVFLLSSFTIVAGSRAVPSLARWFGRFRLPILALLGATIALVLLLFLILVDLTSLTSDFIPALQSHAIYVALGLLFGFALLRWFKQERDSRLHLQWGIACFIIFVVGLFFNDIRSKFRQASTLSTPLISLTIPTVVPLDDSPKYEVKGADSSYFSPTDFAAGVAGFRRISLLAKRDSEMLPNIAAHYWQADPVLEADRQDYNTFQALLSELQRLRNLALTTTELAYQCLEPYARLFPDGLPLQDELAEVGAGISVLEPSKTSKQMGYASLTLIEDDEADILPGTTSLDDRVDNLFVTEVIDNWVRAIEEEVKVSPLFEQKVEAGCAGFRPSSGAFGDFLSTLDNQNLPHKAMLASSAMLAAGYPISSALVLARWLNQNKSRLQNAGRRELFVRRLFQIRAMTEMDFVLSHAGKFAPLIPLLSSLDAEYSSLLESTFGFDHHGLNEHSCDDLILEDVRRLFLGGLNISARYLTYKARVVGDYNRVVVDQADRLASVDLGCFENLVDRFDEDYRAEFYIAAAETKVGYATQLERITAADRIAQLRHLEEARDLLERAISLVESDDTKQAATQLDYEHVVMHSSKGPAQAERLLRLVTRQLRQLANSE